MTDTPDGSYAINDAYKKPAQVQAALDPLLDSLLAFAEIQQQLVAIRDQVGQSADGIAGLRQLQPLLAFLKPLTMELFEKSVVACAPSEPYENFVFLKAVSRCFRGITETPSGSYTAQNSFKDAAQCHSELSEFVSQQITRSGMSQELDRIETELLPFRDIPPILKALSPLITHLTPSTIGQFERVFLACVDDDPTSGPGFRHDVLICFRRLVLVLG